MKAAVVATAMTVTAILATPSAHAEGSAPPVLADGFGLTQVADGTVTHSDTDFTITVTTPEVSGPHRIRIFLPRDYRADPAKRWPVTYFLHGGGGTVDDAAAAPALRSDSMITVVPDGGLKSWYADWVMQNTPVGAANWETFHLNQVIPFIDANLRTIADRDHRAVVGLSMGGSGALHYAEARPDLFGHAASLSGGLDFDMAEIRGAVLATELNLTGAWCAVSTSSPSGTGKCTGYGPTVDSDAIYGSPYPVFDADRVWKAVNPAATSNLARLTGVETTIYTGDQGLIDHFTDIAARRVKARMDQLGIDSRLVAYGNGATLAPTCDGGHNYGCWSAALADYIPRLQASFDRPGAA
ncbi:alpha/beta hydrolase-fold protein [Streptomyces sp. NBC_00654]|uniref:alpha/beta hydrolase n=1 Tax=Streptomyces sp. NBC_00654 TaxID=2975799 RepID=UPI002259F1CD|nr:alpha/beta hydrolase-fold protein [Streptomyces sp. NBC_00654]MCX4967563.1 alpha/beta hydrolase-fold protein [Streptomyces sp. NBC_00654]